MGNNFKQKIVELSESKTWEDAKVEWDVDHIDYSPEWDSCLCGHPIKELIFISNMRNGNETLVGNCCINRFFEEKRYTKVFNAIKKRKFNLELIEYCHQHKIVNDWEHGFLLDVLGMKRLTMKQGALQKKLMDNVIVVLEKHETKKED